MRWAPALAIAQALVTVGCAQLPADVGPRTIPAASSMDRSLIQSPPRCVAIDWYGAEVDPDVAELVEAALTRHLAARFPASIAASDCDVTLEWSSPELSSEYLLVWTRRRIALDVQLVRHSDNRVLWRSSARVERNAGGLPMSPVSIALGMATAARAQFDRDELPSMIDDVVRQAFSTLPQISVRRASLIDF